MSDELANINTMSNADIMKAIGQDDGTRRVGVPRLTINRNPEDDDGNQLPMGSYAVFHSEVGQMVYGKPVSFRPFLSTMQYMQYSPEKEEYVNRSIIFKNWKEEAIDIQGGTRCSKIPQRDWEKLGLTNEELANQRTIKCYRLVFGQLTFDGHTADKTAIKVTDYPVLWRVTGVQFNPVGNALQVITERKKLMFNCSLNLDSQKKKNGSNVYYVSSIKVDADARIKFSKEDEITLGKFQTIINGENADVLDLYKNAQKSKLKNADIIDAKMVEDIDPATALAQ